MNYDKGLKMWMFGGLLRGMGHLRSMMVTVTVSSDHWFRLITAHNISSTRVQANLLRLSTETLSTVAATTASDSHGVSSALEGVGNDEARGELEVAPRPDEIETSTSSLQYKLASGVRNNGTSRVAYIVLGVHVKEGNMLNPATIGVFADRPNVRHPDSSAVVRLEHDAVGNVKIVIHSSVVGGLESARPLGVTQVGQVDDVGFGNPISDYAFYLVELVVQQHELVPVALRPPSLVCVRGTGVFEATEHFGVGFVGRVPDCDTVLG